MREFFNLRGDLVEDRYIHQFGVDFTGGDQIIDNQCGGVSVNDTRFHKISLSFLQKSQFVQPMQSEVWRVFVTICDLVEKVGNHLWIGGLRQFSHSKGVSEDAHQTDGHVLYGSCEVGEVIVRVFIIHLYFYALINVSGLQGGIQMKRIFSQSGERNIQFDVLLYLL